jgi:transcriptional regulator with XRE-family HTH domain
VKDQGLTQQNLGDMVGLSQTQISAYLRGDRFITLDELDDMCRALGLSLSDVIAEADELR